MIFAGEDVDRATRSRRFLIAALSVLLLMWPALVNRQPFFFSDTTSYLRAGDAVARIVAGPAAHTVWTMPAARPSTAPSRPNAPVAVRGSDPASGYIMAGRSPYFGLWLWLSWVTTGFWLFVLVQAMVAYWLIGLMLRCFGVDRSAARLGASAVLAVLSPLAVYNGVLLADALSGFGIAAFLILSTPRIPIARWERVVLLVVLAASVVSHLTHLVMIAGMAGLIAVMAVLRWWSRRETTGPIVIAVSMVVVGALSIMVTGAVVKAYYGKPPVLVPLITARFIADGPGRAFIESGCGDGHYAVCSIPYRAWDSSTNFLWSRLPESGAFLLADAETRRRMSTEDKAFAGAVARAYPWQTVKLAIWNTWLQFSDLRVDIVDERCFSDVRCTGEQFPRSVVRSIAATAGGQGRWPVLAMNFAMYTGAFLSVIVLAALLPRIHRRSPEVARQVYRWLALIGFAMFINAFLGGAISEPQSRYQTRMFWLLPMMAVIVALLERAVRVCVEGERA